MKLIAVLALVLLATGCTLIPETLVLRVPASAYPGDEVTVVASGVTGGQFTFTVGGKTYTQAGNSLAVEVDELPCEVSVVWFSAGKSQTATETIYLKNAGPVIGRPVLNAITDLWTIHPRGRYTVTFPGTYDPEDGPVTLVDVTVYHTGQGSYQTVFCPPYTGADESKPKPDLYRVRTGQGDIENAFVFYSIWKGPIDGGSGLPYSPPSQQEAGYPGAPALCGPEWPRDDVPSGVTIITPTYEDEMGARTAESFEIPTMYYPGC